MFEPMKPLLKSSKIIKRYENNPILSAKDIPYKAELIFNAGIVKFNGQYVMIFRNDYSADGGMVNRTNLGIAFSDDGVHWNVSDNPFITSEEIATDEIRRIYDPRLTAIEDKLYMTFAMDTEHGVRGGIARLEDDFSGMEILSLSVPDNRNMVLFPEKVDGMYVRLERPFPVYSRGRDRFDIWISKSPDLKYWGESELLLGVENVPYANDKIGPAAPPVKTDKGWLTLIHAVDKDETRGKNGWEDKWQKRYTAGIILLDINDPSKVIGMSKLPLLAPETDYEVAEGFRTNVIFPGGLIIENDGEAKIYYGASDTVECLATAKLEDLLSLCVDKK